MNRKRKWNPQGVTALNVVTKMLFFYGRLLPPDSIAHIHAAVNAPSLTPRHGVHSNALCLPSNPLWWPLETMADLLVPMMHDLRRGGDPRG